ncbi:MAG: DNA alkylation repair protein [Nitrososphaerales archaeon]|jgi:3-methyladenine DNA glycosylase AlkC
MVALEAVRGRVSSVAHGFRPMQEEASEIVEVSTVRESLSAAEELYASDVFQVRMVSVFVLGSVAARSPSALRIMRRRVSSDPSWQVQEVLAKAFDRYCKDAGYERALPAIEEWLGDENPNVRRAATEGLRIWNRRDFFREHPDVAVRMLAGLKGDPSLYVRRSVGNALRDVSRTESGLVAEELATWDRSDSAVGVTYALASRLL